MSNYSTIRPIHADALNQYLAQLVEQILRETLVDTPNGQCMRVDELPPEVIGQVANRLHEEPLGNITIAVLHDDEGQVHSTSDYRVSMGKAVELRNDPSRALLVFVPPDLRAGAIDSLGANTFIVVEQLRRQALFIEAKARLEQQLQRSKHDSAIFIAKEVVKLLEDAVSKDDQLRYYLTVLNNPQLEQVPGAALYCLGLFPDFAMPIGDYAGRLKQNEEACATLEARGETLLTRISKLKMRQEENRLAMYKLLRMHKWRSTLELIATDTTHRGLALEQWLPKRSDEVYPLLYIAQLNSLKPRVGEEVREFSIPAGKKGKFTVSWTSEPAPSDCPNVAFYRLELLDSDGAVVWTGKNKNKGKVNRQSAVIELEDGELPAVLYHVRVRAYDSNGNRVNEEREPRSWHDQSREDSRRINESEDFWLGQQAPEVDSVQPINRKVASLSEAVGLAANASTKDTLPEQRIFEVRGEAEVGNIVDVRFSESAKQSYSIELNPHLAEIERQILAHPQLTDHWTMQVAGNDCIIEPPNTPSSLPAALFTARKNLFTAVQHLQVNNKGGGVFAATDLSQIRKQVEAYVKAYISWLSDLQAQETSSAEANASILYDLVNVRVNDRSCALLMAPSHPLLLLWQLEHSKLQSRWLSQRHETKTSVREEMNNFVAKLIPRNLPMLIYWDTTWLVQSEVLRGGWSLYLPVERADRRMVARSLSALGVTLPADSSSDELVTVLIDFVNQHPYVGTLKLNVFGDGPGNWLADTLVRVQHIGQEGNPLFAGLRYDIRLFNSDRDDLRESGIALTALLNPERQVSEDAAAFAMPTGNYLHPKLSLSRHQRSDFLDQPSHFDAHFSLLLEPFPVEAGLEAPINKGRSSYIAGLVQQPTSFYESSEGSYAWYRQLVNADDSPISQALNLYTALQSKQLSGADTKRPTISLKLDADSINILYQMHDVSDWVLTLDANLGLEYFDAPSTEQRPIYLLAYTPPYLGNTGGQMMLTTRVVSEVIAVMRRILDRIGIPSDEDTATLFLTLLRSLSGQLALRLLASQRNTEELVGLIMTRLYLEQHGLLQQRLLIPLDAHLELMGSQGEGEPNLRGDLLVVEPDPKRRRLVMHIIETKYRRTMPVGTARRELDEHIVRQLVNTRNYLQSRFDFDRERADHKLRIRELTSLLEFYLARARRYKLIDDEVVSAIQSFIYSLDSGYKLEFRYSGLIFSPHGYGDSVTTPDGVVMVVIGEQTIRQSLSSATASDGDIRLQAVGDAQEIIQHFSVGSVPHLRSGMISYSTAGVGGKQLPHIQKVRGGSDNDVSNKYNMEIEVSIDAQIDEVNTATPADNFSDAEPMPQSQAPIPLESVEDAATADEDKEDTIRVNQELQEELVDLAHDFTRAAVHYKINVQDCNPSRAVVGPGVMRLYVRLAKGQPMAPLRNALEDIGREMKREKLLITSIPNSDEIALDIPRTIRQPVPFARGLRKLTRIASIEQMPLTIGVTPEGEHVIRDLATMPHMLVGGTTGAGKTIFLYTVLCSLIFSHPDPNTLRLFVSTSKPEDFTFFRGLPHLESGAVISDAQEAVDMIGELVVTEFDRRRVLLEDADARDISEYNKKSESPLAPFVVVVDEFADLADQLAGKKKQRDDFYTVIRRIAQLGRNRGVHLILCTQRPSVDLVPSNIRTLMNTRVALRMNDAIASRMILDDMGAEQLQKHGDLLFKEDDRIIRAQGYFITTEELKGFLSKFK